ncbi:MULTISPECIES: flagellin N-terminal helical domain-containing protein [Paenibacillus]|uniref:flagellin N-terminal helical domain-containing protein n=1 Tax=Paenibacillus TaxID=44249 RepID=UPI002041E280|nr:flagellin [Paenibacillus camelliae]MCM3633151.1 flagellin FliC [Paenibacillus camelliae]
MYIQTNMMSMNLLRNYQSHQRQLSTAMERLSTGYRINRAADDPAGLAISERMRFQINGLKQASRNIQDGISLIQTAEGAMIEIHAMLQRMNVLANQAANGTYSDSDRSKLQLEFNQLREEITSIAAGTNFNGIKLLDGQYTIDPLSNKRGLTLQVGEQADHVLEMDMPNLPSYLASLSGLDLSTSSGAQDALQTLKETVDHVSYERAKLGAYQNRLEHRHNFVLAYAENLTAAESRIRDADMALEMTNFIRANMLSQVSVSLLAQANAMSKNMLKLLEAL